MNRFAILAFALFSVGCNGDDTTDTDTDLPAFDLTFTGVSYDVHNGKSVHAMLQDEAGVAVGAEPTPTTPSIGVFQFVWADVLDGQDYTISWYVDVNGDGACAAPPADQTWTHTVSVAGGDADYEHTYATNFDPSACAAFVP